MPADQPDDPALDAARLLLGVARLGDGDLLGWWNCSALDPDIGQFVVANTFRRTGRIAATELLLLSAVRRHRGMLPRATAVHLFSDRLPLAGWTRGWLSEQKTAVVDDLIGELESWRDPTTARSRLAEWAGESPIGERVAGALELGRVDPADVDDKLAALSIGRSLAACYVNMDQLEPAYFNLGSA